MVALYIITDSLKVETAARTKSITLRTSRRATTPNNRLDEALLSRLLQNEKSITWTTVTGEKVDRRQGATMTHEIPL